MIEGHGDDLFRYGSRIKANFSTNIPQDADHSGLLRHLHDCGVMFRNYPEPDAGSVADILAYEAGLEKDNILVTNGATEAIYLLAHLFEGKKSAVVVPTFREYQDACKIFRHKIKFVNCLEDIKDEMDLVWLCNPNNPTGKCYALDRIKDILAGNPNTIFVIDQAYDLYSVRPVMTLKEASGYPNLVVLQSLTKRFSIPGLRLGYAVGNPVLIESLKSLKMPWSVNSVAICAAEFLLSHANDYQIHRELLHNEAERIMKEFEAMGIEVYPTDCNFFLSKLHKGTAAELKKWLVDQYGLLIRDASNFEGLTDRYFRIAAQGREENDLLIKAVKEWNTL